MLTLTPIAALSDNYIWWLHNSSEQLNYVVDPSTATEVIEQLSQGGQVLHGILITHHHWDHTGGIDALLEYYGDIPVYGPSPSVASVTHPITAGTYALAGLGDVTVFAIPGHTLDHLAYYFAPFLFCGDTLFSGGCGRLFEGTAEQMVQSLSQLQALPDDTLVCCAHEYTLANLKFAMAVEPDNQELIDYQQWVIAQRDAGRITLPSTIAREKAINPFLRCHKTNIQQTILTHQTQVSDGNVSYFALLRQWKDKF
ncbi:hydroxyacylglutathione hydrolase [Shewanella sp. SNU WT4]|uniref:hydroxyacylglutathione hydrolase n=1 Tax=Shewanella sp. SNU WT4 TaxID=2590015 RepID=UPI001128774D|nr:hydroxyacylglutathione hydrolase [Shewanella sp. SNU WT4]QDF67196.1 hydroxyacylglutathione hydrolase [Shewanella sp. SNU WT4]